jgi:putative hemolysin
MVEKMTPEEAFKAWELIQPDDPTLPEVCVHDIRRASFLAGRASLEAELAEAKAERDEAVQVAMDRMDELLKAQLFQDALRDEVAKLEAKANAPADLYELGASYAYQDAVSSLKAILEPKP